jgi:DNA-binding MarR family transcriptional regulator
MSIIANITTYQNSAPLTLERTTPVPNWVLDCALSSLTDSQAKLLLIIARQTNGWADGTGNRKTSDWMSSRFIQEKTGCSESSVSRAIAALVAKGLIEVRDSEGNLLLTAAQRRRCKQMYFALNDQSPYSTSSEKSVTDTGLRDNEKHNSHAYEGSESNDGSEPTLQVQHLEELQKLPQVDVLNNAENAKTVTSEEVQEIKTVNSAGSAFTSTIVTLTDAGVPSIEANNSVIREDKTVIADTKTRTVEGVSTGKSVKSVLKRPSNCGTTKEIQTKENLNNSFVDRQNDELADDSQNDGSAQLPHFEGLRVETYRDGQPNLSNEAKQVLSAYRQQFRQYFPEKAIPKATPSDFEKLKSYFVKHKPQVLISLLPKFFTIDYDFNSRNEYSLHAFVHSVNLLLYGMKRIGHFARIRSSESRNSKAV